MTAWTCHAHPVALNGQPCGHENRSGGLVSRSGLYRGAYCEKCGCTKHASDLRKERAGK